MEAEGPARQAEGPAEGEDGGGQPAAEPDLNQWHLPAGYPVKVVQLVTCPLCGFPAADGQHGDVDGQVVRCVVNVGGWRPWRVVRNVVG